VQGGLNTYRYTRNPLDYIDPLGLSSCETSGVTPEDAMKGEEGPVGDDGPAFQNIELAGAVALARAPAPVPNLPTSTVTRVVTGVAANDAVYAVERSLFSRVLPALGTAATFVTGMLYSPELGGGLEQISAPDGTVYSKHGDERIWNAAGVDGSTWQTASPQEDMEYRAWLANGGDGSFAAWLASGKPSEVESLGGETGGNKLVVGAVSSYGEANKKTDDGTVHRDHQPSKAALKARAEELAGRRLSPAEDRRIENAGISVNVPDNVHRAGPTYGGKNAKLIQSDKNDLAGAATRDADAMVRNASELAPEHVESLESAASQIKSMTNDDYDDLLDD